jgi:hypothetical protein
VCCSFRHGAICWVVGGGWWVMLFGGRCSVVGGRRSGIGAWCVWQLASKTHGVRKNQGVLWRAREANFRRSMLQLAQKTHGVRKNQGVLWRAKQSPDVLCDHSSPSRRQVLGNRSQVHSCAM